jgi:hypothetical protein
MLQGKMKSLTGQEVDLTQYLGKVLLVVWDPLPSSALRSSAADGDDGDIDAL